ncbi:MAG: selenocysteine-specific translation elongation factor [Proteobacteria bacterium]|nr:selenocysteine-specific translation elongation factor [Pseudomonadota bacterium]
MIVGTAGHIDHGKTTLVRALTGVDTDRLPEEKKRGISIELGYAFMPVPAPASGGGDERIGFIDVPGHERLVHTMLSGATGIDYALLLVAADDGPMPQTREHLAVLSLLGLSEGAVVITKCDRVDAARVAAVRAETQALLQGSGLQDAPICEVSAASGAGIAALKDLLLQAARTRPPRSAGSAAFRLAVDRAFTLDGVGTVVTGTVHAGRVAVGDELQLVPGSQCARVRSLHAQNRPVPAAAAGQRGALALAAVAKDKIHRGQWLVAPAAALQTTRLDARLALWRGEAKALRSGTVVHLHLGAADVLASVAVLAADEGGADSLAPGAQGLVQLVLQQPVAAWWGDRVVLRDASASRTLAGGTVLDPFAPARYRRTPQRLSELAALAEADVAARALALLALSPGGVDLARLAVAAGAGAAALAPAALPLPAGALRAQGSGFDWALGAAQAAAARQQVLDALAAHHRRAPDDPGPDAARLRRLALPRLAEPLWQALLNALLAEGLLRRSGAFLHLPEQGVRLSATEQRLAQKVAPLLAQGGFEGAWVRDLARDGRESEALVRTTLARLAQRGELHQVVKDLYYADATVARLAGLARRIGAGPDGAVTAAAFRDATGLGRKRAIQILEYFDRIGLLRRVGDEHRLRGDCRLFMADGKA